MTIALITGMRGFVGTHLAKALHDKGLTVAGFDILDGQDIRNYEQLRLNIEKLNPDYIYHLAAQAYVPETSTNPRRGVDVNIHGTLSVLEAVRHTGCRAKLLVAGTSAEFQPYNPYGITKLAASNLALTYSEMYGIPVVVTRAYNHTGPGQSSVYAIPSFAKQIAQAEKKDTPVLHGNLNAFMNYTDVRDIVEAYQLAIETASCEEKKVFTLCSDNNLTMRGILDRLTSYSSKNVNLKQDNHLYRPGYNRGSNENISPSYEEFNKATGWKPNIPLDQTLKDTLEYWRDKV